MKNTIKLLTLLLAVVMMIQAAPLSAIGDTANSDTYEQPEQTETEVETEIETEPALEVEPETEAPETEAPEIETEPETDAEVDNETEAEQIAIALESITWRNGFLDEAFETLTDGMTVDCNYLIIRLALNAAPLSVEATVDGVAVQASVDGESVLLPVELLNGYHTFSFTVNGESNTVTAEFGLTVDSDDASYPELQVTGASALILGKTSEIVVTGKNTASLDEILVSIKMSAGFKVEGVDIAKGYVGTYSWFRGDLKLNINVFDADKIADDVVAIVRIKAPATIDTESGLFWNVEDAVVTPAEGETVGKTENFQGTVSVPETEVTVAGGYTVEGITPYAVGGQSYTLLVMNDLGEIAADVAVYVVNGRKNVLLGRTDENGLLTVDSFEGGKTYTVFAEDDNGIASAPISITFYTPVGAEDGAPYSVLFNGVFAGGKGFSWMSHIIGSDGQAVIRVATSEDMADAILYNGVSTVKEYAASGLVNRVNSVTVSDLAPGVYYYQVGDGSTWSEVKAFTVKAASAATSFAVIGNMANTDMANLELIANAMAADGVDYSFAIQTGNAITNAADHEAWLKAAESFGVFGDLSFIRAFGKDEMDAADAFGAENGYRFYTYNNVFVGVIDYTEDEAALNDMLDDLVWDAKANDYAWRILVINQAPYTTDAEKAESIAAKLVPAMAERAGMDLVLSGDECNYARTESIRDGKATVRNGVTYIVCGSAGEKTNAITAGDFAVTNGDFNALYLSVTADEHQLTVTVYNVLADGTVETVDTLTKTHFVCNEDTHLYRFGINVDYIICDYCGAKALLTEYIGVIAFDDMYLYVNQQGFASGWKLHDGQYYYFSPKNFVAVNGEQVINGYTYYFEDCVLTKGHWVTENGQKKLIWANGKPLTSSWYEEDGVKYYLMVNGVCATGKVMLSTKNENGETVYETYVFDENGVLIGKE